MAILAKFPSFRSLSHVSLLIGAVLFFPGLSRGAPVCSTCHPKETAQYLKSAMGNSLGSPSPVRGGTFTHERSKSTIAIEQRDGRMIHRLSERGLTAEYPIVYQIGSGKFGRSYMVRIGDYLLQSPASWYASHGWDVSPGFELAALLDFDRPMDENCLFCHAGVARFSDQDGRRLSTWPPTAITCERCHGNSENHVRRPSSKNIVNPAKVASRARDSICEQCHLKGAARILNPGESWQNFRPGDNFEDTATVYLLDGNNINVASQVEQLSQSKCGNASAGKLWCGSCHDAHGRGSDRVREVRDVCTSCHPALKTPHPSVQSDCVSCHMPRRSPTGIAHVAITDHRIRRTPAAAPTDLDANPRIPRAWREPQLQFRKRNLGLAYLTLGFEQGIAAMAEAGAKMLEALPTAQQSADPAALAGLAWMKLQQGEVQEGVSLCRRAVQQRPLSADYAMKLGIALTRSGDLTSAEQQLNRAIDLDPSLAQAYMAVAMLYDSQKRTRETKGTLERYLKWKPQNIMFRLQNARTTEKVRP